MNFRQLEDSLAKRQTSGQKRRRQRSASAWAVVVLAATVFSHPATCLAPHVVSTKERIVTDDVIAQRTPSVADNFRYLEETNDDDVFENDVLSSFQQLQKNTGSEVVQTELQHQIDGGASRFLQHHGETQLEHVAMSSVTEQLPQPAVKALLRHDEELALGRIIQAGAALFQVKQEEETKMGRELTKTELAAAVSMSTKQLRQTVSNYRKAKYKLVTANLGLVHAVVNKQWNPISGISKEEYIQEGSLGLLRAAELFDPNKGLRFSTYAVVWIKGVLSNSHVPELVRIPSREKTKMNKVRKARRELERDGTIPTLEEIAEHSGLKVHAVVETQRLMSTSKVLSLDSQQKTQSRSGTESATRESILDKDSSEESELAERTQLQADVIAAMARNLDAREARLLRLRYGLSDGRPRTLHECAESMGLSYGRVHQLSKQCLKKLRQAAEAESLEEYLLTVA